MTEADAHEDMRKLRIRSEWFVWGQEIAQYAESVSNLFPWIGRDGLDGFEEVTDNAKRWKQHSESDAVADRLWKAYRNSLKH